ncbi:MAG: CD1247 N-terminal domain-containing protein [Eubacterium sp.]
METTESLGYLKGLIEGLDLDSNKKEAKVYNAIIDVLSNLVEDIDDMTEGMEMLADQVDAVDEDLADLEEFVYDDFDCDCDCDCDCCDDECGEFEVECPLCGAEITVDEDTVLGGTIPCPNCGEMLEFEIEECDCEDDED